MIITWRILLGNSRAEYNLIVFFMDDRDATQGFQGMKACIM